MGAGTRAHSLFSPNPEPRTLNPTPHLMQQMQHFATSTQALRRAAFPLGAQKASKRTRFGSEPGAILRRFRATMGSFWGDSGGALGALFSSIPSAPQFQPPAMPQLAAQAPKTVRQTILFPDPAPASSFKPSSFTFPIAQRLRVLLQPTTGHGQLTTDKTKPPIRAFNAVGASESPLLPFRAKFLLTNQTHRAFAHSPLPPPSVPSSAFPPLNSQVTILFVR